MDTEAKAQNLPTEAKIGYKRILVAVDYLDLTPEVFAKAVELAQSYGSNLMIFHCVQGDMPGVPSLDSFGGMGAYSGVYYQEMSEFHQQMRQEAIDRLVAWLGSFCQQAAEHNIEAEFDYKIGEPGPNICSVAENWQADLIVIGRRGRSGVSELFLGSVSNYVVHHAHCSVLVVQH